MARYTITDLRAALERYNQQLVDGGCVYYLREHGRNGYQAVDLYKVESDGHHSCQRQVAGGSSRECADEAQLAMYQQLRYTLPSEITRVQAYEMLKIAGMDFSADEHTVGFYGLQLLSEWAKRAGYRKPRNANASKAVYFFRHLKRNFHKEA